MPQIPEIQAPRLTAPQAERVDRLQQHRVTLRCQRALPAPGPDLLHPPVSRIEEGLHLVLVVADDHLAQRRFGAG